MTSSLGREGRGTGAGELLVVGTPIGNLGDLTPRARAALGDADVVLCEDTRRTRALMSASGLAAAGRLVAMHEHNEAARAQEALEWLAEGRRVAVVTDAGMPGISDPGFRLISAVTDAGWTVTVVPGPSSVLAALVVSGLPTDRFCVEGFLPKKGSARRRRIEALRTEERTTVVLEAPGRVGATLGELAEALGPRPVAVARELTKLHEEVWRGSLADAAAHFAHDPARGEFVLVVGGAPEPAPATDAEVAQAVAQRLALGEGPRAAADAVAAALGVARRRAYEAAIVERRGTQG